jgi:hypothetical protein
VLSCAGIGERHTGELNLEIVSAKIELNGAARTIHEISLPTMLREEAKAAVFQPLHGCKLVRELMMGQSIS